MSLARSVAFVTFRPASYSFFMSAATILFVCANAASCIRGQRASDTGDPGLPFGPTFVGITPLAFVQDIKPIFDHDCLTCHSARDSRGNYSVGSYADAMSGQRPGNAQSSVVVDCSPGGSMYRYFSGDAITKATMVFRWIVVYNGAETR
jgi:hypothetical protein